MVDAAAVIPHQPPEPVTAGREARCAEAGEPYRSRRAASTARRLVTFVGENDSDILPFFLDHYRRLGVDEFHVTIHGAWSRAELEPLDANDVAIAGFVSAPFDEVLKASSLDAVARGFDGEWIVIADADEFLELPYASLDRTIAALECLGLDELPANLVQRAAPDGALLALAQGAPETLFSSYDYRLVERMSPKYPVWKSKFPLTRVGSSFSRSRGSHHPHNKRAVMHFPIRGVLHRFKWRDRLRRSVALPRESNEEEQNAYREWLQAHDWRVPIEGLTPCDRKALLEAGFLVRPTRHEFRNWSALRKARFDCGRAVAKIPSALPQSATARPALDRRRLAAPPGRIALITTELLGLKMTGGIGTAMSALAERLASVGHEVHVFLVPWGDRNWPHVWADHWRARGCHVHHLPARSGWTGADLSLFVADALIGGEWDVVHFPDNGGLGAVTALMRSAGLAFQNTQLVVTAHGPTRWHRHGNLQRWSDWEAFGSQLEDHSIEHADVLVCPSEYIAGWSRKRYVTQAPPVIVPNSLIGEGKRFGRGSSEPRKIQKVVFYGRIEPRKGIDRFIAAIDRLLAQGISDFEVVFLGRFVPDYPREALEQQTSHWTCRRTILPDYTSHDAQGFLRTESCLAVMPSRLDNSPYVVLECLDNAVPFLATEVGGVAELVHPEDRAHVLASGDPEEIAERIAGALRIGAAPVRPSFDPALADIDLLALHANLVAKARASRGRATRQPLRETTVIIHGPKAEIMAPPLAEWFGRIGGASIEVLISENPDSDPLTASGQALNEAARRATHEHLLFCHTATLPDQEALSVLLTALERTNADAAVCGYRFRRSDGSTGEIAAFAGPSELSSQQNVYGARLLLVRKTALVAAGGFSDQPDIAAIAEWEFLNRLNASGRKITAVPAPLASTVGIVAPSQLSESQRGALTLPWAEAAPPRLQGFMRMALHSDASPRPVPHPSFHSESTEAGGEPAVTPFFRGIDPWDDSLNRDGRLRIGPDGRLRDASGTYRIETAGDASDCDFLVADGLVTADTASLLTDAYGDAERRLICADAAAPAESSFLWLREIASMRPDAVAPILKLVEDALARTSAFYELDAALHRESVQLRRIGTGGSMMPPRRIAPRAAYPPAARTLGFAGHLVVQADCEGGGLYLTGLDMEVAPERGRLVGTLDSPYHERAVFKVTSGELLMLSFAMRTQ